MKATILVNALAAVLVLAPAAAAKGSVPSRVCGKSACVAIPADPDLIVTLYPDAVRPQPPTLPHYRLDYHRAPGIPPHYYVPARRLIGQMEPAGRWFRLEGPAVAAIEAAIRGLEPFPAPASWTEADRSRRPSPVRTIVVTLLLCAAAAGAVVMAVLRRPVLRDVSSVPVRF